MNTRLTEVEKNLDNRYSNDEFLEKAVDNELIVIKTKGTFIVEEAVHFLHGNDLFCFLAAPWVNGYTQNSAGSENILAMFKMGSNKSNDVTQGYIAVSVSYLNALEFSFVDSQFNPYDFGKDEEIIILLCFKPAI